MCLIPGLADGKYLVDDNVLSPDRVTEASCLCGRGEHRGHGAGLSRREVLSGSLKAAGGAALASALVPVSTAGAQSPADPTAPPTGDDVVFLGTNGGPILSPAHAQPSAALAVNGTYYLVDAGADCMFQLQKAKIPLGRVSHLFITHNHSDHMAGYPVLAGLGRAQSPPLVRLDVWGPQQRAMHKGVLEVFAADTAARAFVGIMPLEKNVYGHDVTLSRGSNAIKAVFEDNNVKVSAIRVDHGSFKEVPYAYGYRFDLKLTGKSVVFSGDTAPTDRVVKLAQGADLLVHEAMFVPGVEQVVQSVDPSLRDRVRKHILDTHTDVAAIPKIAKAAGAKRVALTHYVPAFIPADVYADTAAQAAATVGYGGEILAPSDLTTVVL